MNTDSFIRWAEVTFTCAAKEILDGEYVHGSFHLVGIDAVDSITFRSRNDDVYQTNKIPLSKLMLQIEKRDVDEHALVEANLSFLKHAWFQQ